MQNCSCEMKEKFEINARAMLLAIIIRFVDAIPIPIHMIIDIICTGCRVRRKIPLVTGLSSGVDAKL
jgi:hypothetical protein